MNLNPRTIKPIRAYGGIRGYGFMTRGDIVTPDVSRELFRFRKQ